MKRVLITGGAGYIGSKLIQEFLSYDYKVRVYDSMIFGGNHLSYFLKDQNFELIKGDIREGIPINDCDAVVHLASMVFTGGDILDPFVNEVNYEATKKIVDSCKKRGVRLVYTSTCSNYGKTKGLATEDSELQPINIYAKSKIKSEQYILSKLDDNFKPLVLRLSTVFGLSPRMRFDLLINQLTMEAHKRNEITVFKPNAWRPSLHIDDAVEIIERVTWQPFLNGVYNIGSNKLNYRKKDLCNILSKELKDLKIDYKNEDEDERDYKVSFEKAESWNIIPKRTIKQGVKEILEALKNNVYLYPYDILHDNLKTYTVYYHDKVRERGLIKNALE